MEVNMAAFLEDITPFLGENRENELGQNLEEFLRVYDPNKYPNPSVTADVMVFWSENKLKDVEKDLKLLLIRRKNHPSIGWWALPGGFVDIREDADAAAKRELEEETGLTGIAVEQLCAWGDYNRDPRTRIVTIAYVAVLENKSEVQAGDDAEEAAWFDVSLEKQEEKLVKERKEVVYALILKNPVDQTKVIAKVKYSYLHHSILKDEKYEVLETNYLAFDHPAFIVKGLLHISNRVNELS
jgi:8-oxo-dGTP diphosphatase